MYEMVISAAFGRLGPLKARMARFSAVSAAFGRLEDPD